MIALLGVFIVTGCVIGGFLFEGGHLAILVQPAELLIIGGAAIGSFLIASPMSVVMDVIKAVPKVFFGKGHGKDDYLEILGVLYRLFAEARKGGTVAIDQHVNNPSGSSIISRYPKVAKDDVLCNFICDNLKVVVAGNIEPHVMDAIMDLDVLTRYRHASEPSHAVAKVADSLPGLGIVAAVLGVVLTMGKLNEPPEVLGHSIGAALLGTFLGVLLCYGFVGPIAANLEHSAKAHQAQLRTIKAGIAAFVAGLPPLLAAEAARRAIPGHAQPSFEELEEAMKRG